MTTHALGRKRLNLILCVLAAALAPSCANVQFTATGTRRPSRPPGANVEVFLTGLPSQRFEEIGLLEICGDLGTSIPDVADEARLRGANAVALLSTDTRTATSRDVENILIKDADGNVIGIQEVPVTSTYAYEVHRFVALWLPTP